MSGRCRISAQPFPRWVPGTGAAGRGFTCALCPRHPRQGRTSSHTLQHMIEISPFWSAAHGIVLDRVPGVVSLLEKKSHEKDTCPVLCSNRHSNRSSGAPFRLPWGQPPPCSDHCSARGFSSKDGKACGQWKLSCEPVES